MDPAAKRVPSGDPYTAAPAFLYQGVHAVMTELESKSGPLHDIASALSVGEEVLQDKLRFKQVPLDNVGTGHGRKERKSSTPGRNSAGVKALPRRLASTAAFALKGYSVYAPLHALWTAYIVDVVPVSVSSIESIQSRLLKADLHGAYLSVIQAKCPSYVGIEGILLQETANTFVIVSKDNTFKTVPKMGCIFNFTCGAHEVTLYGNQFRFKAAERTVRKFKCHGTLEL